MKIVVQGLWHLGSVTAACLAAKNFDVTGLAEDAAAAAELNSGKPPLFEPGLAEMMQAGLQSKKLQFTADPKCVNAADIVWVCFDTPVDEEDRADIPYVTERVATLFPYLKNGVVVLISSQLPVGNTTRLAERYAAGDYDKNVRFAYSPENLRLGKALDVFLNSERIVIGVPDTETHQQLEPLFKPLCPQLLWMNVASAEMVKHALNSYLATCITFTNEIATICEGVGAQAHEVEQALRLDPRIGKSAYVRAGAAFGGGTLARDVRFLNTLAQDQNLASPLLNAVIPSNDDHRQWPLRRLTQLLGDLTGKRVGVYGLAYKPGTDAIRRSEAIALCEGLLAAGAKVKAFDPQVKILPAALGKIELAATAEAVAQNVDAVILITPWPEFANIQLAQPNLIVLDQHGFWRGQDWSAQRYFTVGSAA